MSFIFFANLPYASEQQITAVREPSMRHHEGKFIRIWYEMSEGAARIITIEPYPETYLRSGVDHLLEDIRDLIKTLSGSGVTEIRATPDRSAARITLEEAGFREMSGGMVYAPEAPLPAAVLDEGRPGAFGPETPVSLEGGGVVLAGTLHPGMRLADGGRVEEVMTARLRRLCRLDGALYGALNRVVTPSGPVPVTQLPHARIEEGGGTDMIWVVTERSRVRSGAYLFEDMWGSPGLRQQRRISQAQVIAALNAGEAPR